MFNRSLIKRLENENEYLRKVVDNLLSRLGVEKVSPAPEHEDVAEDDGVERITYGG